MPLSQLKDHGYDLHKIQLMQPTETSPVGLKLTKQQDPLQYIITAVAKETKADLAGLKVNDWLIKIEDDDIRSVEFSEVSQNIRQLLTNDGLINMVVARKTTLSTSPSFKTSDQVQTAASSSRTDSFSRQQGGNIEQKPCSSRLAQDTAFFSPSGSGPTSLLTTDITRDTPNNNQVRFVPEQPTTTTTSTVRSQRSPIATRDAAIKTATVPLSVGLTNPISDDSLTKSPRSASHSPSRSPAREYIIGHEPKTMLSEQGRIIDCTQPDAISLLRSFPLKHPKTSITAVSVTSPCRKPWDWTSIRSYPKVTVKFKRTSSAMFNRLRWPIRRAYATAIAF